MSGSTKLAFKEGLEDVVATSSEICYIDGQKGLLTMVRKAPQPGGVDAATLGAGGGAGAAPGHSEPDVVAAEEHPAHGRVAVGHVPALDSRPGAVQYLPRGQPTAFQ